MELKRKLVFIMYWGCVVILALQGASFIWRHPESNLAYAFAMPGWLWAIWMTYKGGDVRWRR